MVEVKKEQAHELVHGLGVYVLEKSEVFVALYVSVSRKEMKLVMTVESL